MMPRSIKVLHILNSLRPSGGEVMLKLAAPFWQSQGLALSILSTGTQPGPFADSLNNAGYEIYHIPFSKSPKFFGSVPALFQDA